MKTPAILRMLPLLFFFCGAFGARNNNVSLNVGWPDYDILYERQIGNFSVAAQTGLLTYLLTQPDDPPAIFPAVYAAYILRKWDKADLRADVAGAYLRQTGWISGWSQPGNTGSFIRTRHDRIYMGPRLRISTELRHVTFTFKLGALLTWDNHFREVDGRNEDWLYVYDGIMPSVAAGFGYGF
jgi:hypothetical protein